MRGLFSGIALVAALLLFANQKAALSAETLSLYMTEIPGQTMQAPGEPGTALEIVRAAAGRAGLQLDEHFLPWVRATMNAQTVPKGIIVPFSRTPSRDDKFVWIGELYDLQFGFISLGRPVTDMASARKLDRIGVWRGSSMEELLRREGFTNLAPVSSDRTFIRMLAAGRFDAWYGSLNEAAYHLRGVAEHDKKAIRFGVPVSISPVWLAGSKKLPEKTVGRLRSALENMHKDGTARRILKKYGMDELL